jgi:hypothetical protein
MANAIMVLRPYYWGGTTWVFDDPAAGLDKEAFVSGIPEMIRYMTRDIPDAEEGFLLTFSATPFPGYQYCIHKTSPTGETYGGNWYHMEEINQDGWLCPALFCYFAEAPEELYVSAVPLAPGAPKPRQQAEERMPRRSLLHTIFSTADRNE